MTPYKWYKLYQAVLVHFTSETFDLFKYSGKLACTSKEEFERKKEVDKFMVLANREHDPVQFCVFNFLDSTTWLYNSLDDAHATYLRRAKYYSAFSHNISEEYNVLKRIKESKGMSFNALLQQTPSGNKPPLLQLYLQGGVSAEFMCMINTTYDLVGKWSEQYKNDPLASAEIFKIKKYTPFVDTFRKHGSKYFTV